jgi:hypothetical protein
MTDILDISDAHNEARLAGTMVYADTGAANSSIAFYDTVQPARGAAPGGNPVVTITLTKPCGAITGGVLALTQADATGDMVTAAGSVLWGRWVNGNGDLVGDGTVSDSNPLHTGFFKIAGANGVVLYPGARLILGVVALT